MNKDDPRVAGLTKLLAFEVRKFKAFLLLWFILR
jgi:hypothetical protein